MTPPCLRSRFFFGTLLIGFAYYFLTGQIQSQWARFGILLAAIAIMPLPALTFTGMEPVLQGLLSLLVTYYVAVVFTQGTSMRNRSFLLLLLYTVLLPLTRFEGLFVIASIVSLGIVAGKRMQALVIGCAALAPIILFGSWSMAHGWSFLPNGLLVKSGVSAANGPISFLIALPMNIKPVGAVAALFVAALPALLWRPKDRPSLNVRVFCLIATLVTIVLHTLLIKSASFFRYESYLMLMGVVFGGVIFLETANALFRDTIKKSVVRRWLFILLMLPFCLFGARRALMSAAYAPLASRNVYEQQYQMGTFLKNYYTGCAVAANDIGLITYLADIRLIDLAGLGSKETFELIKGHRFTRDAIYDLARRQGCALALVYDAWFQDIGGLPPQWTRMGRWIIGDNIVCAGDTVSFYACAPGERARLARNLGLFAARLPRDVVQMGGDAAAR